MDQDSEQGASRTGFNPPFPPLSGGEDPPTAVSDTQFRQEPAPIPSPDKGRVGEGFSPFLPYDPRLTARARENRAHPTVAERLMWEKVLRHRRFHQYKFLRQKPLDRFIVDFYCAELRLAIEIDGDSHAEQALYDEERTRRLNGLGVTLVRFTNTEVSGNLAGVFDVLARHVQSLVPPLAQR